jgi:hypothetical protein
MAVAAAEHIGDWLNALPITSCGLRLDKEAIRVAVGLRLGCSYSVTCISVPVVPWWTHAVHTHFHTDSVRVDKLVITISTISYREPLFVPESRQQPRSQKAHSEPTAKGLMDSHSCLGRKDIPSPGMSQ